ncbi:MAG TPA: rod shape-determining protein MreC [Candidatus Blautia pullicola]|jgi:rod shape-determining protein MreC|uniref:Cell shape-determining protein MreC n=1 Tax=Candidatus Blautia pullicola TaxID=2838498 RepID=A0A9D2FS27_9FIRM|nr:rod shape-determining protein MreC [Candidatus Blautia pullicola]
MKKKHNWVIKSKHVLIIMILVCVSLMLLAAAVKFPAGPVKNAAGYVIVPFQKGINKIGIALDNATAGLQSKKKLVEENQKLQEQVDELTAQNSLLTQDLDELDRLQKLYQLDQQYSEYDKVAAEVISMDDENWFSTFTINRGTDDGIQKDCNVIAGSGLVGIVTDTGKNWATVRSIIDDSSNVSAMTMSTSDRCIVSGDLRLIDEGKLQFIHLKDDEDKIQEGEKIITSDVSDKFLKGILIGYVSEIEEDPNNLTKTGTLTPVVDFEHLREVLVITELKQQKGDS